MRGAVLRANVSDACLLFGKMRDGAQGRRECGGMPATFRRHDNAHTAPTPHHLQLPVGQPSVESLFLRNASSIERALTNMAQVRILPPVCAMWSLSSLRKTA